MTSYTRIISTRFQTWVHTGLHRGFRNLRTHTRQRNTATKLHRVCRRLGHAYYPSNNNYIAKALVSGSCAIDNAFCCIFLLFTPANFKTTAMLTKDAKILKMMANVHAGVADTTGHDQQNTVVFHTLNGTFHTIHHQKCSGLSANNTSRTKITSICHD